MNLEPRNVTSSSSFYCWAEDPREASMHKDVFSMTVNQQMFDYFSQPDGHIDLKSFVGIYCLNPLGDDDCPVGICPNPDIAGLLVRIAHYITAFCLTILIFNAPNRVKDSFYYQISTVYALLITCSVSLFQANITRLHATIAICIVSSPVSIYFLVYSIRAFWGEHRLDTALGKKKYLNRGLVFLAAGIWIAIVVYTSLKSTRRRYTQGSCDVITGQEVFILQGLNGPPYVIAIVSALSWAVSIVLARKEIWPPGERYRPKFVTVWKTIGRRFPFVFFMSIGLVPFSIWVWSVESILSPRGAVQPSKIHDNDVSLSYGQVLSLFIAVPPFLQVCQVVPQIWPWLINLTWIACCRRRKGRREQLAAAGKLDLPDDPFHYMGLPMISEGRNGHVHGEGQETQESVIPLTPNRYYGT